PRCTSHSPGSSLHESTSVCPPLLISSHLIIYQPTVHPFTGYTSPLHRLNHLYILHYLFALCTIHKHTSTRTLSFCTIHTSTRTLYFCTIHTDEDNFQALLMT